MIEAAGELRVLLLLLLLRLLLLPRSVAEEIPGPFRARLEPQKNAAVGVSVVSAETQVPCIPPPGPPERGSRSRPISAWPAASGWYVSGRERLSFGGKRRVVSGGRPPPQGGEGWGEGGREKGWLALEVAYDFPHVAPHRPPPRPSAPGPQLAQGSFVWGSWFRVCCQPVGGSPTGPQQRRLRREPGGGGGGGRGGAKPINSASFARVSGTSSRSKIACWIGGGGSRGPLLPVRTVPSELGGLGPERNCSCGWGAPRLGGGGKGGHGEGRAGPAAGHARASRVSSSPPGPGPAPARAPRGRMTRAAPPRET